MEAKEYAAFGAHVGPEEVVISSGDVRAWVEMSDWPSNPPMPTEPPAPPSSGRSRLLASVSLALLVALLALVAAVAAVACGRGDDALGGHEENRTTQPSTEGPAQLAAPAPLGARVASRASRPAGVPDEFVRTPSGYMHPSCITLVAADEIVGADRVIRKKDGRSQRTVSPCAYPRYSPRGREVEPAHASALATGASGATALFYDGWLAAYESKGALPFDTSIRGKWVVPPAPSRAVLDTTLYFFDDLVMDYETDAGFESEILQPVLGYGAAVGQAWTLTSWNCCNLGSGYASAPVNVAPGDVIEGTTVPDDCDGGSVCEKWTITATDVSSGESTTLATTEPYPPTLAHPGVLETYSVTACDMLPPTGLETFYDNAVTEGDAGVVPVTYDFASFVTAQAVPCGYSGVSSGDSFTLVFGPSTPTTTLLESSAPSVTEGSSLVFSATVVAGSAVDAGAPAPVMPPTGQVTFTSGGASLGTALLVAASADDGGVATSATASLAVPDVGAYAVIATYAGNGEYLGSSSASAVGAVTLTLVVSPSTVSVAPSGTAMLSATGGVGAVTWSMQSNVSGGQVDALGNYNAGTQGGVADVVVATDSLHGSATATINVGASVAISPATPTVAPGGAMKFTASGGSGAGYAWEIFQNESNGTMGADGAYVAGATAGVSDVVEVTDSLGNFATTTVAVTVATSAVDGGGGSSSGGVVAPPIVDAGSGSVDDAGRDGGAASTGGASSGGCGCRTAGATGGGSSALWALGALAMIAGLRRRRNRSSLSMAERGRAPR